MLLVRVYCDLGLVEPFDPRPYTRDWMLHRDEERYLGFLLARAHEVATPDARRRDPVQIGRCYAHGGIVTQGRAADHRPRLHAGAAASSRRKSRATAELADAPAASAKFASYWSGLMPAWAGFGAKSDASPTTPRLQLQTSVSTLPIPIVWASNKIAANVLWYANFQASGRTAEGGGKGGLFGGAGQTAATPTPPI